MKNGSEARELLLGIRRLIPQAKAASAKRRANALFDFPFDALLLARSPLYRRSRAEYLRSGGKFRPTLVSSPRTLSSDILLENCIEYTPMEHELFWAVTDRVQRRDPSYLLKLRGFCASVFHEQNHRLLWSFLPPPPRDRGGVRRYLNFAEALAIATDMALGDKLGSKDSRVFYLTGSTYDPGTSVRTEIANDIAKKIRDGRAYRNYLHGACYATYLNLELYEPGEIAPAIRVLYPNLGSFANRASERSGNLDRSFIERTNYRWQAKHWKKVGPLLARGRREAPLDLPEAPTNNILHYLWAEKWFQRMGL